ncbi:MAG TPA: ParB N-terminal domain-containing protein [Paracoccaceae bacterium]
MAKRKRLTPPQESYLAPAGPEPTSLAAPFGPGLRRPAPIAQVAGDAAAVAALREVTQELQAARAEGRLVQRIALAAVEADHLVRDRLTHDPEEMAALRESLRARGQQTPIEVVDLGGGRYGLISGWRRLMALQSLHAETGEDRFATIQALLRRPDGAADAYLAMVEENEIRVGLGHYERARIAARATEQGVYPDIHAALRHLFASASRAKRSKIGSFVALHEKLGNALRFPAAIPERLGLALAKALEADAGLAARLTSRLRKAEPQTAAAEQAALGRALAHEKRGRAAAPAADRKPADAQEIAAGVWLQLAGDAQHPRCTLSGPKVDAAFCDRLQAWVRAQP